MYRNDQAISVRSYRNFMWARSATIAISEPPSIHHPLQVERYTIGTPKYALNKTPKKFDLVRIVALVDFS